MDAHVHRWILGRSDATGGASGECGCGEERYFDGGSGDPDNRAGKHALALSGISRVGRRKRSEWNAYHAAALSMAQIPNIEKRSYR